MKFTFITLVLSLILLTSCFRKKQDVGILVDFDFHKTTNFGIPNIIYNASAFSGMYVTYADSLAPYAHTIISNFKLLSRGSSKNAYRVSAQINRVKNSDKGSIEFQVVSKTNELLFLRSIYINEKNFVKENEWTKIEELIKLPEDSKLKDPDNIVKIFLYSTKDRILMDDLEITSE
jgi:hypothetical protein